MPHVPTCLAIILCDDVMEDKRSSKKVIIGTFNRITASHFPCKYDHKMTLYLALTDGRGESPIRIEIVKDMQADQSGDRVLDLPGRVKFKDPLMVTELVLSIQGLPLPSPGLYSVRVLVNEDCVGERKLKVEQMKAEGGGDERH